MIKECGLESEMKGKTKKKCVNRAIVPDRKVLEMLRLGLERNQSRL